MKGDRERAAIIPDNIKYGPEIRDVFLRNKYKRVIVPVNHLERSPASVNLTFDVYDKKQDPVTNSKDLMDYFEDVSNELPYLQNSHVRMQDILPETANRRYDEYAAYIILSIPLNNNSSTFNGATLTAKSSLYAIDTFNTPTSLIQINPKGKTLLRKGDDKKLTAGAFSGKVFGSIEEYEQDILELLENNTSLEPSTFGVIYRDKKIIMPMHLYKHRRNKAGDNEMMTLAESHQIIVDYISYVTEYEDIVFANKKA